MSRNSQKQIDVKHHLKNRIKIRILYICGMATTYFLLGGNLGDRFYYLDKAAELIEDRVGTIVKQSSYYETEPWGFDHEENLFMNKVLVVKTALPPEKILRITQKIEHSLGRSKNRNAENTNRKYDARKIDVDILFHDDCIVQQRDLSIPHPHLHERLFTLAPLCEINPNLQHPVMQKTIKQLLHECKDKLEVSIISKNN